MDPPIRYIPTVVSPVPEEEEEDNEDVDDDDDGDEAKKKDDFSVQEVVENEPTLLRPPPALRRPFLLSPCSSTAGTPRMNPNLGEGGRGCTGYQNCKWETCRLKRPNLFCLQIVCFLDVLASESLVPFLESIVTTAKGWS